MSSPSTRNALASVLRVALALGVTAFLIQRALPWPADAALGPRIDALAADERGYDVLILGPSGLYRGLDPRIIETQLSAAGLDLRCYNAAAPGMVDWEADFVLREAVEACGERLRWVVLEPGLWNADTELVNTGSYRFLYWHSLEQTRSVVEAALALEQIPQRERLEMAWTHGRLALRRLSGYGTGREFLRRLFGLSPMAPEALAAARESAGYLALEDDLSPAIQRRGEQFRSSGLEAYAEKVATLRKLRDQKGLMPMAAAERLLKYYPLEPLRRQMEYLERNGVRAVHVMPPYVWNNWVWRALVRTKEVERVMEFNDPERYPSLFEPELRYDLQHLTRPGAAEFSRLFGEQLAVWIGKQDSLTPAGDPPPASK